MAQFIYHHYVAREGPMVVSLPSDLRDEITEAITGYGALSAAGTSTAATNTTNTSSSGAGSGGRRRRTDSGRERTFRALRRAQQHVHRVILDGLFPDFLESSVGSMLVDHLKRDLQVSF
jgi:hypothetical protein